MSIRTNPMKAVLVLLKRVKTTRTILDQRGRDESLDGKLDKLTRELNKIEDVFMRVKKNQDELVDTLHEVDGHLRKLDKKRLDQDMDHFCKRIRDCTHKLLPMDTFEEEQNTEIVQSYPSSSQLKKEKELLLYKHVNQGDMPELVNHPLPYCLFTLSIFPNDAIMNKRHTIYCWIGEGVLESTPVMSAEEKGERIIDQLMKLNVIVPCGNGKCPFFSKFKINPHFRPKLEQHVSGKKFLHPQFSNSDVYGVWPSWFVLAKQKVTLGDGDRLKPDISTKTVYNVGASYLNFGSQWMDKLKSLKVLQLGRWQNSPSHHIEVGSEQFLEKIKDLVAMKYLSLRGISRISKLPFSIAQHDGLEILDLKACHNLETLPDDISSMKSLTHLILSQCYLLDSMPMGIDKLTKLQVLKGFLIGSSRKTPGRISDLVNLKKLTRLSIRIGREAVIKDREFESLEKLSSLTHLKISWGVSAKRYNDIQIIFPTSLKRFYLEYFPGLKIPEWLKPSKLPSKLKLPHTYPDTFMYSHLPQQFKELKITGGNLESMSHDEHMSKWSMEIVRLRYLRHLKVDLRNLRELFPLLRYAEIRKISNHSYLECSFD